MPLAESVTTAHLLAQLPGVQATAATTAALQLLEVAMADGDTCLDLAAALDARADAGASSIPVSTVNEWKNHLLASGLCTEGDGNRPLIIDGHLLSSRRFWHYEQALATAFIERAADESRLAMLRTDDAVAADLEMIFPPQPSALIDQVDWQRLACVTALAHNLSVITGGPGTGKTTVAGKTIAIVARLAHRAKQSFRVIIAAPTGKAAQRLRESLMSTGRNLVEQSILTNDQLTALTSHVATLHRLVHDRSLNAADLVVIDEVSMADAATLARVITRVPRTAQIILLGDPHQLASVEAGHVLGEIAKLHTAAVSPGVHAWYQQLTTNRESVTTANGHRLGLAHVHLQKNWRSAASPAVTALAHALQTNYAAVQQTFATSDLAPTNGSTTWVEHCECPNAQTVTASVIKHMQPWINAVLSADSPRAALTAHHHQRILCARRTGPLGSQAINLAIESASSHAGIIKPWDNGHYRGQPILVTRNDYDLQLFNGDIGIVWGERHHAHAWFETSSGELRSVPLQRLHGIESVFAMTIHKSQGSQFEHTEIITALDDEGSSGELLTRELLYTAVTRSASSARLWANNEVLARAIERRKWRRTGLGRFLTKFAH